MAATGPTHGITDPAHAVKPRQDATAITLLGGDVYVQGGGSEDVRPQMWTLSGEVVELAFSTETLHPRRPELQSASSERDMIGAVIDAIYEEMGW